MEAFVKFYNSHAKKHIDLLYDSNSCHIDVITSMKGLFDAHHYCYSSHKAFSTIKYLCSASGCMLCRQSGCSNRTGFINLSTMLGEQPVRSQMFQCDRFRLIFRSLNCVQCHISSGVCHLYSQCPSCHNAVPKRTFSNHLCSKKRFNVCSDYFPFSDRKNNCDPSVSQHQCCVQKPNNHLKVDIDATSRQSSTDCKPVTGSKQPDKDVWVFDIGTDQSCKKESVHKPILLVTE